MDHMTQSRTGLRIVPCEEDSRCLAAQMLIDLVRELRANEMFFTPRELGAGNQMFFTPPARGSQQPAAPYDHGNQIQSEWAAIKPLRRFGWERGRKIRDMRRAAVGDQASVRGKTYLTSRWRIRFSLFRTKEIYSYKEKQASISLVLGRFPGQQIVLGSSHHCYNVFLNFLHFFLLI